MKQTLVSLATGIIAKLIRYALTAAGGVEAVSGTSGEKIDPEKLATGIAIISVTLGWSFWEDWLKKRKSQATENTVPSKQ